MIATAICIFTVSRHRVQGIRWHWMLSVATDSAIASDLLLTEAIRVGAYRDDRREREERLRGMRSSVAGETYRKRMNEDEFPA